MAVFLVQHGFSLPKDKDPEKGLSQEGKENTLKITQVAKSYGIPVKEICHSTKARAAQTAQIFNDALAPERGISMIDGIKAMDDVKIFSQSIDAAKDVMYVGHLPFMEKLVSYLICGSDDKKVFKFQNSGVVCLDTDDDGWFVKWSLSPNIS
ncbi:MAG: phosphohistidine phosphatase SixA [Desulfobacteraceae bacterium]|nr:phosphohistidine phosphatase SixA [Desulfobacteraceae bacterium]